jgi:hypothetical protein
MKLPACVLFVGTAILIACSGSPGSQADSDTSNDSVEPNASRAPNGRCTSARQCTGLLPQLLFVCKDGQVAGDSWECKSDACVIVECAGHGGVANGGVAGSHTASPSGGSTCGQPSDCTGSLPESVVACEDGTSAGASWECNSGTCTIVYCANDGGPAESGDAGSGSSDGGGASADSGSGEDGGAGSGEDGGSD